MRFLPKTTCEKLVKMGYAPSNEYFYLKKNHPWDAPAHKYQELNGTSFESRPDNELIQAFTLEDFVSTDEYAKENCRKLFGNLNHISMPKGFDGPLIDKGKVFLEKRHEIINSEDWVEFIAEAVEKRDGIRFYPSKGKIKQGDLLQLNKDGTVSKAKRSA